MKRTLIGIGALCFGGMVGCTAADDAERGLYRDTPKVAAHPAKERSDEPNRQVAADNTEKNDEDSDSLTAADQGESESDREITREARQSVVAADDISMNGKNVKIIAVDGVVTLRGPVESMREKDKIAALVKEVNGVGRIDNQLEATAD